MKRTGTRQEVWENEAHHTRGGLQKKDLILNKRGKVVSKARSVLAQQNVKRLKQYQYKKKDAQQVARARQTIQKETPKQKLQGVP